MASNGEIEKELKTLQMKAQRAVEAAQTDHDVAPGTRAALQAMYDFAKRLHEVVKPVRQ